MARVLTYGALVASALVLQATVLDLLPLPGDIAPDLVLLVVVALALSSGPLPGLVTGFAAGLALDLAPPASHAIGAYALVFCLVGYVCGRAAGEIDKSAVLPFAAMALGALAGSILYAVVGVTFGEPGVTWAAARNVLPLSVAYDVLLGPSRRIRAPAEPVGRQAVDGPPPRGASGFGGELQRGAPCRCPEAAQRAQAQAWRGPGLARIGMGASGGMLAASGRASDGGAVAPAPPPRARGRRRCRGCGRGVEATGRDGRCPAVADAALRFGASRPRVAMATVRLSWTLRSRFGASR